MVKICEETLSDFEGKIEDVWRIKIKMLRNPDMSLDVSPSSQISNIKTQIGSLKNVQVEQQRLIFRGKVLKDHQTIEECHISDGDSVHLVVNGRDPLQRSRQSVSVDEHLENDSLNSDVDEELSFDPTDNNVSNILNQLFDDITQQAGVNAPRFFLIDQLRRNLNTWDRDIHQALDANTNESSNTMQEQSHPPVSQNNEQNIPFPTPWQINVTDMRQALRGTEEQVSKHLPKLFERARHLVEQDIPEDPEQFATDMRGVAISYRRLGKIFSILGKLCCRLRQNEQNQLELIRGRGVVAEVATVIRSQDSRNQPQNSRVHVMNSNVFRNARRINVNRNNFSTQNRSNVINPNNPLSLLFQAAAQQQQQRNNQFQQVRPPFVPNNPNDSDSEDSMMDDNDI